MVYWELVANAISKNVNTIPGDLHEIFEQLDEKMPATDVRSTQIIGLVILLWEKGVLKA